MTREEAEKYAKNMTYREAIYNFKQAKSVPYRKATFIKANELLKALEQEPRKGHWIGHREHCENLGVMPSGLGAYEWCSNCDCGIDVREWHRNHYNFCPNCGADMRKVEDGNND